MKVCFISFEYPPSIRGGAGTYAGDLVRGLEKQGIEVCTISSGEMEIYDEKNSRVLVPKASPWQRFHFTKRALSLSKSWESDLVHFNGLYPITKSLKLPTVCTLHASKFARALAISRELKTVESIIDLVFKKPILCLFDTAMVRVADKIICPSPSLARELSYYSADNQKIHVIPNGIDLKRFDKIKASDDHGFSKEYPIERENFVLYVGRLAPEKGVEYLIKAFKSIRKEFTNLKLVIVGRGGYEPYLRSCVHNIKDVLFVGFVSARAQKFLYENSLALVVPSLHETFPYVPLEAMACSRPIIATDVGGIHLMVRPGKNGVLVESRNSSDLAKAIALLCQNPDRRREMGKTGRKIVEREFTASRMASETLKVYKLMLA